MRTRLQYETGHWWEGVKQGKGATTIIGKILCLKEKVELKIGSAKSYH